MSIRKEKFKVYEMTCTSCENRVEKACKKVGGVLNAKASYSGQFAEVEYDDELCSINKIKTAIKSAGYTTESSNDYKFMGILIVVAAIVLLGINTSGFDMEAKLKNASYAVLFVVGMLTSIHCVGMCGGIMLSQSLSKESKNKFEAMEPAILYNIGRVVSYTILGGIIGALGSVFTLSITAQAGMQIFAAVFMIMMGFNMAGFSIFRKFSIKLPHAACKVKNKSGSPFIVGLLNGLMPCGPLQTMQLFALGTGSAVKGALSMFMFAIGTVPLMLTFGAISGILSKGYTKKILKFSGVLIIVLGLIMGNRGLALTGMSINPLTYISNYLASSDNTGTTENNKTSSSSSNANKAILKDGVQVLNMTASGRGYTPNVLYVQKGVPVKWVVNATQLTSCNNAIVIPSLKKQQKLKSGENIIEFTPGDKDLSFSCWMGMIRGTIKVVDDLGSVASSSSSSSDGSSEQSKPSIYGNDISKVPTDRLVKKAQVSKNNQIIKIKGTGYELEPLIVVVNKGINTKMSLDLTSFDYYDSDFSIVDANTGAIVKEFTGKKGIVDIDFTINSSGVYALLVNQDLLGVVEAVDDIKTVNLEEIRNKYIR
ncbi:sulfite exporter TauE/SafE family protein [Clostridium kluyveri]|uniref:urease accessory protein UreH domain-containing protein n=1 Tax=Clostridium kluyveri TaxID=1534 RepID=UPI002245DFB6|nr:sulfite exporter TauE/SafE family protein [Clostridium kluyveri]UZQ48910.1 sulfite exporter TauE/SafE family protein [Clostridium kluyveri]